MFIMHKNWNTVFSEYAFLLNLTYNEKNLIASHRKHLMKRQENIDQKLKNTGFGPIPVVPDPISIGELRANLFTEVTKVRI